MRSAEDQEDALVVSSAVGRVLRGGSFDAQAGPVNLFVSAQVGTRFAWSISAEGRQPFLKDDREVVQRLSPFGNWQRPLLGCLVNRHVHQLQR